MLINIYNIFSIDLKGDLFFMEKITENTLIFDALQINPKAGEILTKFGMHCLGCALAHGETVGEAADVHGIDLEMMLEELNNIE